MQHSTSKACLLSAAMLCASSVALAQSVADFGAREYQANCASCHGPAGEGGGPYASVFMKTPPSDLTTLAARHGGAFPIQHVYETIDGRGPEIQAHGPRHMPIWGADYLATGSEHVLYYPELSYYPELYTRNRILSLIDYLYRIQKG